MAKKRPLYELMGDRPLPGRRWGVGGVSSGSQSTENSGAEGAASTIGPGRAISVPIGMVFLGAAIVLALTVGAYILGYQVRESKARAEYQRSIQERAGRIEDGALPKPGQGERTASNSSANSPANSGGKAPAGGSSNSGRPKAGSNNTTPDPAPRTPLGGSQGAPTPATGTDMANLWLVGGEVADPREAGLNYLLMIGQLRKEEALVTGRYFASEGVAIVLLPSDNGRSYTVATRQGFSREQLRSEEGNAFTERINRLARGFDDSTRGWSTLDSFWQRYDP